MKEFTKKYLEILNSELAGLNLTGITEPSEFEIKQVKDSLLPFEKIEIMKELLEEGWLLCDVGFGGGFPLLPIAKFYPDCHAIGLEARSKKVKAVQLIAERMELDNVRTYHQRVEDVLFDCPTLITLKAVGPIGAFLEKINCSTDVYVAFYKGPSTRKKEKVDKFKHWKLVGEFDLELDGQDGRQLFLYQNVPCGTKFKKHKNLVKVSDIL